MIPTERAQRVAEIVEGALEREPAQVSSFLDGSCGDDMPLRREVDSLLSCQKEATDFIEAPAYESAAGLLAEGSGELKPGDLLGEYEILSLLGEGGMGEVYLAEDSKLRRKVAIKLVKAGFGRANLIRHFRQEERILAGLNHPNIARLYGGAVTQNGVPYFVMEYVEGERLDHYCNAGKLKIPERLQLFRKICSAVSYAHQHLVIHRDIKPANIRVTAEGEPKLLDFGIAKLVDPQTESIGDPTMTLQSVMTPEYASPEQVRGEVVTTTTDIYSLGVVLYELLTGQRPYRIKSRRPDDVARVISEEEPQRPSTAVTKQNQSSVILNPRSLRGDLDNIVLMAMRKVSSRRYSTIGQFSEDIQRHLDGLPVVARRDTVGYRASKFIKRHTVGVAAAALIVLTLIGGIVATTWEARRAEQQRMRAERRFNEVRQLANSLMFEIHDSVQDLQGSTPTRRLIVSRALQYLDSLAQESGDNPTLQRELATAYEKIGDIQGNPYSANLGDTDGALASYRKAAAIREALRKKQKTTESQAEMGRSYRAIADILEQKGDIKEMVRQYRRSLELFEDLARAEPDNSSVEAEVARSYEALGDGLGRAENAVAERLQSYRKALDIRRRLLAREPSDARMQRSVALSFLKVGSATDPKEAEAAEDIRTAIAMLAPLADADPNNASARRAVGFAYYQLGRTLMEGGDAAGALESRRKAFAIRQQIATQDPKNTQARFDLAVAHADLSEALTQTANSSQALEHGQQALEILELLCAADPSNAVYQRNLGLCLEKLGEAHERSAADEHNEIRPRLQDWSAARESYQKAAEVFSQLQARGTLMPTDAGQAAKLKAKAAECESAIEQLTPR